MNIRRRKLRRNYMIVFFGPTAVGKSDLAVALAQKIPAQIVNCDIGQFYVPLTIGTAKPNWKNEIVKHHLFDILDEPQDFDVCQYRELMLQTVKTIWSEDAVPILVGGSGFYLKSIFFPPVKCSYVRQNCFCEVRKNCQYENLWHLLHRVDLERASKINKKDFYRINRALDIWERTGQKPSSLVPVADFPSNFLFVFLNRERKDLYERIDSRVIKMIKAGWLEEVKALINTKWETFLKKKGLIGYDIIAEYFTDNKKHQDIQGIIEDIQKKTRKYAKRQITFWNMLEKKLNNEILKTTAPSKVVSINLTLLDLDLYIKQLIEDIEFLFN